MVSLSSLNSPSNIKDSANLLFFINIKGERVRYKDCNILWLSSNRRPDVYAFRDKTLALGNKSITLALVDVSFRPLRICLDGLVLILDYLCSSAY